jgi:small subunit ribosomal protein S17
MDGKVVKDRMKNTVIVERNYFVKVPKYERYRRERSRIMVHVPPCMRVSRGQIVRIGECRKIAKNVHFVIIEKEGEKKNAGNRK